MTYFTLGKRQAKVLMFSIVSRLQSLCRTPRSHFVFTHVNVKHDGSKSCKRPFLPCSFSYLVVKQHVHTRSLSEVEWLPITSGVTTMFSGCLRRSKEAAECETGGGGRGFKWIHSFIHPNN